ncbi:hypothetical protein PR048_023583 [Dryococelus australis]|uniref:Uncharacterized protein n=1 Tax=Dryococelus australis TaxID=614101 RepID=A0ABQ9GUI7_9NEOP|nr:hypothetical protein PR048_023583 [Dryococelus australis]
MRGRVESVVIRSLNSDTLVVLWERAASVESVNSVKGCTRTYCRWSIIKFTWQQSTRPYRLRCVEVHARGVLQELCMASFYKTCIRGWQYQRKPKLDPLITSRDEFRAFLNLVLLVGEALVSSWTIAEESSFLVFRRLIAMAVASSSRLADSTRHYNTPQVILLSERLFSSELRGTERFWHCCRPASTDSLSGAMTRGDTVGRLLASNHGESGLIPGARGRHEYSYLGNIADVTLGRVFSGHIRFTKVKFHHCSISTPRKRAGKDYYIDTTHLNSPSALLMVIYLKITTGTSSENKNQ